jgi:hypothetical protein
MRLQLFMLLCFISALNVQAQQTGNIGAVVDIFGFRNSDEVVQFVSEVYKASPAEKAGLRAGDIILTINGKSYSGDIAGLANNLSGKPATNMTLVIERFGQTMKFIVTRQVIPATPAVSSEAKIPALKTIRNVDISNFSSFAGECLVGNCKNGRGIAMNKDGVMNLATSKNGKTTGLIQFRGSDFYTEANFVNDSREGKSYTYHDDGTVDMLPYKNDKEEGIATVKTADGAEWEFVYKGGEKISSRRTNAPTTKPVEKMNSEDRLRLALKALEPEAERARRELTKRGDGKVTVYRSLYLGSSYVPVVFKATRDVVGYYIWVIYLKGDAKAEGYFNYTDAENFPLKRDEDKNVNVLNLKIATYPGKFGTLYLKSSDDKPVPGWVIVASF